MKFFVMDRLSNDVNGNARYLLRGWDERKFDMGKKAMEAAFPNVGRWNEKKWGLVTKAYSPSDVEKMLHEGDVLLRG